MIRQSLGAGGFGAVYRAEHTGLGGKAVAVKQMTVAIADPGERDAAVRQFQHEARLLASLKHPHLVAVNDFFEENGDQFLVMEYINGATLEDVLKASGQPLPVRRVLAWALQLCDVLEYLHGRNPPVLFRDLKPNNIMVDAADHVYLIDFGISRVLEPDKSTTTFIKGAGTAAFSPPEQYGGSTDERADIYALGASLYYLLSNTLPMPAPLRMADDTALPVLQTVNPEVTPRLAALVDKMMMLKREDRLASMSEVVTQLREVELELEGGNTAPSRPPAQPPAGAATPTPVVAAPALAPVRAPAALGKGLWMGTAATLVSIIVLVAVGRGLKGVPAVSAPAPAGSAVVAPSGGVAAAGSSSPVAAPSITVRNFQPIGSPSPDASPQPMVTIRMSDRKMPRLNPIAQEVWLDGQLIKTNVRNGDQFEIRGGRHEFVMKFGGKQDFVRVSNYRPDGENVLAPRYVPEKPPSDQSGSLFLTSTPGRCTVVVDNGPQFISPFTCALAPGNNHIVEVSKPGFRTQIRKGMVIRPRCTHQYHFHLEPAP